MTPPRKKNPVGKLHGKPINWKAPNFGEQMRWMIGCLSIHGYMSPSQARLAYAKLRKQWDKEVAE